MTRQSDIINANFKFLDNKIKEIELFHGIQKPKLLFQILKLNIEMMKVNSSISTMMLKAQMSS